MTSAVSYALRLSMIAAFALTVSACGSSSPPTTTGTAGSAGGTTGSDGGAGTSGTGGSGGDIAGASGGGGAAGAGSDGGLCNGQVCAGDQFCCGPPACGYCARILQGPNCATTCN